MIHLTRLIVLLIILIIFNSTIYAQQNTDSIRVVNEAIKMIDFSNPEFKSAFVPNMDNKTIADMGFEQPNTSAVLKFKKRDGIQIHGQKYQYDSNKKVLLLHGTLANSYTYNKMAGLLREATQAKVIAVDFG
ncbi:MAG: hypothetical protein P8K68_06535 [Algibacter sp.]|uniref:hypothetical protein n=1 Tax=Algibacter sp. TaxID=1872428 RepID=UPI002615E065|nr:hypothetical protein [Algibacter sp.]MDG1729173.1 hypothetical protein [Algibacter sp.]MDG2178430.1 hypothetical protein [Algibacter sp.]